LKKIHIKFGSPHLDSYFWNKMCQNIKSNTFITVGSLIRQLREDKELPLRKIAAQLDIDTSFLSKIERSERKATKEQIYKLVEIFEVEKNYLMVPYLSEIIYYEIGEEDCANHVLRAVEQKIKNKKSPPKYAEKIKGH